MPLTAEQKERYALFLQARNDFSQYCVAQRPHLQLAAHHRRIIEHLEAVERGEIMRLMIFVPPQFGKELADSTPVLTANRGWITHGELLSGDYVFTPSGEAVKVLAVVEQPEPASLEVELTTGAILKVHPNHEWTVFDRSSREWRTMETRQFVSRSVKTEPITLKTGRPHRSYLKTPGEKSVQLVSGTPGRRGAHCRFQLPLRAALQYPERTLEVAPYSLGAWLGDGTSDGGCISHAASDVEVAQAIGQDFQASCVNIHRTTGVHTSRFLGLRSKLRKVGVFKNKHIPAIYQQSAVSQRLELLAGLIDTDGCVDQLHHRVTFSNTNARLAADVAELVRSFGWHASISITPPALSSSHIQGVKDVYQVSFSPDLDIPTRLPRKRIKSFTPARRRIGIKAVRVTSQPEKGRCIQVDRPDGLYLVGRELTPTHNSTFATKLFPAWYLGRHPDKHVFITSYGAELAEDFGAEVRDLCSTDIHAALFPACKVKDDSKAKHDFVLTIGGACRAVGVGGSITGRPASLFIIDDPEKDKDDAKSEATQRKLRSWLNDVVFARARPTTPIIMIKTRWDPDDIAGWELEEHGKTENWTVLSMPALGSDDENGVRVPDETETGSSLWPEMYPTEYLLKIRDRSVVSDWLALYQQTPTRFGDTQTFDPDWIQRFEVNDIFIQNLKKANIYLLGDPANAKNKKSDFTVIWLIALMSDQNYYFFDAVRDKLNQAERWESLYAKHKKWNPIKKVRVAWEEYGLNNDSAYFREKMKALTYSFWIEPLGGNTKKEDRIKGSLGMYSDKRFFLAKEIPGMTLGRKTNIAEDFLETEYTRYPAVRHDDALDCAARIRDPKLMAVFPRPDQNATDDLMQARSDRRKHSSWMGL
jgi:hypothetical protein